MWHGKSGENYSFGHFVKKYFMENELQWPLSKPLNKSNPYPGDICNYI